VGSIGSCHQANVWLPPAPPQLSASPPTVPEPVLDDLTAVLYEHRVTTCSSDNPMKRSRTLFADVSAMKDKIREKIHIPEYNVTTLYNDTGVCQRIARSERFETLTLAVIALNALWLALDTDLNHEPLLNRAEVVFQVAEHTFCAFFTAEWFIRLMAFRSKRESFSDRWFAFDTLLVFLNIAETWIMTFILMLFEASSSSSTAFMGNLSTVRIIRLIRLLRMARMAKLLRLMPELVILVKGMATASRSVLFTLVLMMILIYVFAIAFTQVAKGTRLQQTLFSSVPRSMSTLLLTGTVPDLVETVEKDLAGEHIMFAVLFFLFILFSSFTLMNLLVGVLVEVVSITSIVERENLDVQFVKSYFANLVQDMDKNGDQLISREEFNSLMHMPEALKALQSVGVDVIGLVDLADFLFRDNYQLPLRDFMDLVLQLRGANKATVRDIVDMRKLLVQNMARLEGRLVAALKPVMQLLASNQVASLTTAS